MEQHSAGSPSPLIRHEHARQLEHTVRHPLNPQSEMHRISLGDLAGLQRLGVHLVRLDPTKEGCVYHTHTCEEEFIYILSGRGRALIDGAEHEVGPGDFMGFPTPSVPHHLWNPFNEPLTYLTGGERRATELCDFPRLGKLVIRRPGRCDLVDLDQIGPLDRSGA